MVNLPKTNPADPGNKEQVSSSGTALGPIESKDLARMIDEREETLDGALRKFGKNCSTTLNVQCRLLRNSVQDRLIASSNAICREYKNGLKRSHAETNIDYGSTSTLFGGLGAMVTSATPARLLSGAAAVTNGMRAEVNQSMYSMLAIEIVTKAIDKSRQDVLKEIDISQRKEIGNYTIERALADAEEYHTRCSLLSGLQEASSAVAQSSNVGIKALSQTLDDLGQSTKIQIGRKYFNLYESSPVFLDTTCVTLRLQYTAFIDKKEITRAPIEFKGADSGLNELYESKGNCEHLAASKVDDEWKSLITNFTKATDEKDKERILDQIAAQQTKAVALSNNSKDIFARKVGEIQNKLNNLSDIEQSKKDLQTVYLPELSKANPPVVEEKKSYTAKLKESSKIIASAKAAIMRTNTPPPPASSKIVDAANDAMAALNDDPKDAELDLAKGKALAAYRDHIAPWAAE